MANQMLSCEDSFRTKRNQEKLCLTNHSEKYRARLVISILEICKISKKMNKYIISILTENFSISKNQIYKLTREDPMGEFK